MDGDAEVVAIDPSDEDALREWYTVESAAVGHDRPHAHHRTWGALAASVREPGPYYRRTLLAARASGQVAGPIIGVAELGGWTRDNLHLGDLEVNVLPAQRRTGVGTLLYDAAARRLRADGRTSVVGELHVPVGTPPQESAGHAFATARGFASVHEEDHLVLPLPADHVVVGALTSATASRAAAYDVVTWRDRCPDEHLAGFCAMRTQMADDVPMGEVDYVPVVVDEARVRTQEERQARSYVVLTAVAVRRADGVMAGYSQLFLAHDDDQVTQDDTLVMPEHRGHRLGTALKLATLEVVTREHPGRRAIHTYTDPANQAMYRTNTGLGFVAVERMHEMQRRG